MKLKDKNGKLKKKFTKKDGKKQPFELDLLIPLNFSFSWREVDSFFPFCPLNLIFLFVPIYMKIEKSLFFYAIF